MVYRPFGSGTRNFKDRTDYQKNLKTFVKKYVGKKPFGKKEFAKWMGVCGCPEKRIAKYLAKGTKGFGLSRLAKQGIPQAKIKRWQSRIIYR